MRFVVDEVQEDQAYMLRYRMFRNVDVDPKSFIRVEIDDGVKARSFIFKTLDMLMCCVRAEIQNVAFQPDVEYVAYGYYQTPTDSTMSSSKALRRASTPVLAHRLYKYKQRWFEPSELTEVIHQFAEAMMQHTDAEHEYEVDEEEEDDEDDES